MQQQKKTLFSDVSKKVFVNLLNLKASSTFLSPLGFCGEHLCLETSSRGALQPCQFDNVSLKHIYVKKDLFTVPTDISLNEKERTKANDISEVAENVFLLVVARKIR